MKPKSLFLVLALCAGLVGLPVMAQPVTITLLHVNDTHSHLDAFGPKDAVLNGTLGGIAKAATVIGTVRATEPNVLLLHAGDVFQGDFFFNQYFGVPELQMMYELGFDAMAVGNHEFDFGPDVLNFALTNAFAGGSFPLVSANLDLTGYPPLAAWIQPSIIKNVGGVRIGIFGMTVPGDPFNMAAPVVIQDDIVGTAQQQATALRTAGAQVVICLSHLGLYVDRMVAAYVSGIDIIVGGHDHLLLAQPLAVTGISGRPTLIVQSGQHYRYVGKLRFTFQGGVVSVVDYQILNVDASVPAEPAIQSVVDFLKAGIVAQYGNVYESVVGTATVGLPEVYDKDSPIRDTPLGNLVTDAFRARTGTAIAITPNGLISEEIHAGPIVPADVFRALSYGYDEATGLGFKLATFRILGAELLKGLEIGLSQLEYGDDFAMQVSGMTFRYQSKRPAGHRVVLGSIKIGGRPFIPVQRYTVTANTGLVMLLDLLGVQVDNVQFLPDFEYHVVKDYIAQLGTVTYGVEGRICDMSVDARPIRGVSQPSVEPTVVEEYKLVGNYPNPFNLSTNFQFAIGNLQLVTLKVFDILGRDVATLVNEVKGPGTYTVTWDAGGLPSGVYFCKLQANGFSDVKKAILMK